MQLLRERRQGIAVPGRATTIRSRPLPPHATTRSFCSMVRQRKLSNAQGRSTICGQSSLVRYKAHTTASFLPNPDGGPAASAYNRRQTAPLVRKSTWYIRTLVTENLNRRTTRRLLCPPVLSSLSTQLDTTCADRLRRLPIQYCFAQWKHSAGYRNRRHNKRRPKQD